MVHPLVVLTNIEKTKNIEMVNTLFEDAWEAHISNLLVLASDKAIQAWTFITIQCEMKMPFKKLFPEKMLNMKKCPLYVSVADIEPYVITRANNLDFDDIDVFSEKKSEDTLFIFTTEPEYMRRIVFWWYHFFYFEKNSRLRARFNRCIRSFDQAGLIDYWTRQYAETD